MEAGGASPRKLAVAVAGMPGSGKSTVAKLFEKAGFKLHSLGDVVRREAARLGVEPTSENLLKLAAQLRAERGPGAVAELLLEELKAERSWPVVIDGVRSTAELRVISEVADCVYVVAVHASPAKRLERLRARGRPGDPEELEELAARDAVELGFGLGSVIALADAVIVNESALSDLESSVKKVLEAARNCPGKSEWKLL